MSTPGTLSGDGGGQFRMEGRRHRDSVAAVTTSASTTTSAAARAVSVTKIFGEGGTQVVALDDVSVELGAGRFTAIMGPSGSGKSTLMHCLAGLDSVTAGRVFIGETDLTSLDDKALTLLRRDRVGFVFPSFNLAPTLTAIENIRLPLDLAGRDPDRAWLDTVIATIGPRERLRLPPSGITGLVHQPVDS